MKRNKYHYAIDNLNRLVLKNKSKEIPVQGQFSVNNKNCLLYCLNEPEDFRKQYELPSKITFLGKYRLNSAHDLELELIENKSQNKGDCLVIKTDIISTQGDSLVFEVKSYSNAGLLSIYLLKLTGNWHANELNQVVFSIQKGTSPDILTLTNNWQINKNQQIIYKYQKSILKRKTKVIKTVTFEGFWNITDANKITYVLSKSSVSYFEFRVQIESPNLYPKDGVIKYRIGIGISDKKKTEQKIISFYGAWKFGRRLGLSFDMDYGSGVIKSIQFGTEISLCKSDKVECILKNNSGEYLGINIIFTHTFLKKLDVELYVRLKADIKKYCIESGIKIPF